MPMRPSISFYPVALCGIVFLGCGGSKSTVSVPPMTANFTAEISWFPEARSIRTDAASLKVIIQDAGNMVLFERVLDRPLNVDVVQKQTFRDVVPRGAAIVTYIADDDVGGRGNELARGSTPHEFVPGSANPVPVVLGDVPQSIKLLDLPPRFVLQGTPEVRARYQILNAENKLMLSDLSRLVYNPETAVVRGLYSEPGWHHASIVSGNKTTYSSTWVEPPSPLLSGLDPGSPWPMAEGDLELSGMGKGPGIQSPIKTAVYLGSTLDGWDDYYHNVLILPDQDPLVLARTPGDRAIVARLAPKGAAFRYRDDHPHYYNVPVLHRDGSIYAVQNVTKLVRLAPASGSSLATSAPSASGISRFFAIGNWLVSSYGSIDIGSLAIRSEGTLHLEGVFKGRVWGSNTYCLWPGSLIKVDIANNAGTLVGFTENHLIHVSGSNLKLVDPVTGATVSNSTIPNVNFVYYSSVFHKDVLVLTHIGTSSYEVAAFRLSNGQELWRKPGNASHAFSNDGLAYLLFTSQSGSSPSTLQAVDVLSGQVRWTLNLGEHIVSRLSMAADGTLYCLSRNGNLVTISE